MKLPEFWRTGLAVLVLGGLGSYIWLVESKREVKPEGERDKVTVLTVDKDKAKEISLEATGVDTIKVAKEGDAWKVVAPYSSPADSSAVDSLLTSLGKVEADEVVVEQTTDLAQYGLEKPSRTVSVRVEGGKEPLTLQFGAKSPDGSTVYARTPSSPRVYLVPSWIEGTFEKKPFDLRDRDLLHIKRDDVRTVEITGPEASYSLARTDAGDWAFTKPLATRAGRWSVDGLLGTVENLRMDSVAAEDVKEPELKRYGLEPPSRTVALVLKDGQTRTLQLGAPAPEPSPAPTPTPSPSPGQKPQPPKPTKYYAREAGTPLVAVVPAAIVDDLAKGMGELRAKRLLEVATYDTEGFDVVAGGSKKVYAKSTVKDKDGLEKTQWKRTAPDTKELETNKVEDALFKLGGVEVQEFLDQPKEASAYGLDTPVLKVTVRAKGETSVEVGKKDGSYYARRSNDSAVLKLDPGKAEELVKAFTEL